MSVNKLRIRVGRPEDADEITALTMKSKAWWGYDAHFMRDAADQLQFRWEIFPEGWVFVLVQDDEILGFCSLRLHSESVVELHDLFVHPSFMGKGYGKVLWEHALQVARKQGFAHVLLNADPHAEGFYLRMGARRVGKVPSAIRPGRTLPVMHFALSGEDLPAVFELPEDSAC